MIAGAIAVLVVFSILIVAEKISNHEKLNPEIARKFVHITVGSFVATWPFFMERNIIYALCAAFVFVIAVTRISGLFPSIHKVHRKTFGDILFPLGIAGTLFLTDNPWIFAACILHLSLADGFAALVGEKYGTKNSYNIMGYKKTAAGNIAFLLISLGITVALIAFDPSGFNNIAVATLFLVPIFSTTVESISVRGTDNIFVPISLALLLTALQAAA